MKKGAYDTEDMDIELSDDELDAVSGGWLVDCGDNMFLLTNGTEILVRSSDKDLLVSMGVVAHQNTDLIDLEEFQSRGGVYDPR